MEKEGKIKPEQALAILKEGGIIVSRQEAIEILELLYSFAEMALEIYVWNKIDENNSLSTHAI